MSRPFFLNREQDRLNKIEEMEPMVQTIESHETVLERLKNEHTRLITVGTLKLSNLQIENNDTILNSNEYTPLRVNLQYAKKA